jgi:hypothetical protein
MIDRYLVVPYGNGWRIILNQPADGATWSLSSKGGFNCSGTDVRIFPSSLAALEWAAEELDWSTTVGIEGWGIIP